MDTLACSRHEVQNCACVAGLVSAKSVGCRARGQDKCSKVLTTATGTGTGAGPGTTGTGAGTGPGTGVVVFIT